MSEGRRMATDPRKTRRPLRSPTAAIVLYVLAFAVIIFGFIWSFTVELPRTIGSQRHILSAMFGAVGIGIAHLARRLGAKGALSILRADRRRPILFLRPFKHDAKYGGSMKAGLRRHEEFHETAIVNALAKSGPLVAIGRPGEWMSSAGIARLYTTDEAWKSVVSLLIQHSQLIIVAPDSTDGVKWELEHLCKSADPFRVLFLFITEHELEAIPWWQVRFVRARKLKKPSQEGLKAALRESLGAELPETTKRFELFRVDERWQLHRAETSQRRWYHFTNALQVVRKELVAAASTLPTSPSLSAEQHQALLTELNRLAVE
jgi:hypothetical protein